MRQTPPYGFTLIELLITIGVLVILLTIGLPSFQDTIRRNRVAAYANELRAAIALARSEGMRSAHGATLCAANATATACDGASTDWGANGWLVWVNNNASPAFEAGDSIVRVQQADPRIALTGDGSSIAFDGRGRPDTGFELIIRPTDCPAGQDLVRAIGINASGQTKSESRSCDE